MAALVERLLSHGIRPQGYSDGNHKLACPKCSHTRRKRSDPCLSLTIEGDRALWLCHHCQWSGAVNARDEQNSTRPPRPRPAAPIRPKTIPGDPTPAVLQWLTKRGISAKTAQRNRVGWARAYILALGADVDCVAFPYY